MTMKLTFCGADHEVTGSCHLLEIDGVKILFDCGMFQGSDFNEGKNFDVFPFDPTSIDYVLVSHAHLDHVGRIPKLVKEGFRGKVYMTEATKDLAKLVWEDAYSIMQYNHKKFQSPLLFTPQDIVTAAGYCQGVKYDSVIPLGNDVAVTFRDVGHIFGSAFLEVTGEGKTIAYSGDVGNNHAPIIRDTANLGNIDILLCESTYGDRIHEDIDTRRSVLLSLITDGIKRGGTIMVPSFSIERTQELLYELHTLIEHEKKLPLIPIFLDSPLAIDALKVFKKYPDYYDDEAARSYVMNDDFLHFPSLRLTYTREESKEINMVRGPKMVIAGAGMMNGGRILHHALRYLSDSASTLIIVGYQAQGTLGRKLYEGATSVIIFNEDVRVRCKIKAIGALSAHGDQQKLLSWIGKANTIPKKVFCVHGESHAATELAHRLRDMYSIETFVPTFGETVEI